jgi:hypothetical protein
LILKKEELITSLLALMSYRNINRKQFIELSVLSEIKLDNFLKGKDLSIKTIFEFAYFLVYELDIVYQKTRGQISLATLA